MKSIRVWTPKQAEDRRKYKSEKYRYFERLLARLLFTAKAGR